MRATSIKAAGTWSGEPADSVVLDYDDRHRRRISMKGTRGLSFLLDLPDAVALRSGDALALEDGRLVEVVAAPEPLLEIRCTDPLHLARVAWHLGNRHVPTQLLTKSLRIRRDHVLEEMLRGLGARVIEIEAPFDPEGGAYAAPRPRSSRADHHDGHHHGHSHQRPWTRPMNDEAVSRDALYRLMTWLSPAYPVGAFSYSSGIEWAVEAGDIRDAESLRHWLEAILDRRRRHERRHLLRAGVQRDCQCGRCRPRRTRGAIRRLRADPRAPSRNDQPGPRLRRRHLRRVAMPCAHSIAEALERPDHLSGRRRRGLRRSRYPACLGCSTRS